ncbi:MAG: hypothetical protein KAI24_26245 [Planctomycetes bacterium]|nr:hypothetical protein [Planctomycetota bacterium]
MPFVLQARLSLAEQAGAEGRRQEAMRLLLRDVLEPLCKWAIISVKGSLARSSSYRAFAKRMDADSVNAVVDRMGLGVMRVVMSQVGLVGPMAQLGRDHASLASPDAAAILDCLIEMRNQFSHDRVGSSAGGDEACGWVSTSDLLVANWLAGAACELVALRVRILAGRPGGDAQAALE